LDESFSAFVEKICDQQSHITSLYVFIANKGLLPEYLEWKGELFKNTNQGDKAGGGKIN
jgi:hypothetical protein